MPDLSHWVQPVVIEGRFVRLEPLHLEHAADLARNCNPEVFAFFMGGGPASNSVADMEQYIEASNLKPAVQPYAMVLKESSEAVGSTTFMDIRPADQALEIGSTWISPKYQGGFVNPDVKRAMLAHAFEQLSAVRVCLKCDGRNLRSARAIAKLGAKHEGVLRKLGKMPDGFIRDTVMFSILTEEWPQVRQGLDDRLDGFAKS